MPSDTGNVSLSAIADLLEDRTLTDIEVLSRDGWQEKIGSKTRPFLNSIASAVNVGKVTPYTVGDVEEGRECYDNLHWTSRQRLRLTVRLGPWYVSDDVGDNLLVWGIFGWVRKPRERDAFLARLRDVERKVPGFAIADAPVRGIRSGYVGLIKSVDPTELRQRDVADLVSEIKKDLETLSLRF